MVKHTSHCPYLRCPLGCRSKAHHRASYAELRTKKKPVPLRSPKINYDILAKLGVISSSLKNTPS